MTSLPPLKTGYAEQTGDTENAGTARAATTVPTVTSKKAKDLYTRDRGLDLPTVTGCSGDAPHGPKKTSTARVRKHRALKAALRADQESDMTIRGNPGLISEWLIELGDLDPMEAESPQAISDALSERVRKLRSVS
ncbi:hypothetical protein AB7M17_006125 [Bradyrhizobium sp. USDA 377]